MKLHTFIRENMDHILKEWDVFAHTLLPQSAAISDLALRDHAAEMLRAVALDIESRQSPQEQEDKSHGLAVDEAVRETAASIHGALRHESNFSLTQLSAEFRALRACVLRLWLPNVKALSTDAVDSMIRFNEAIDQALAESIVSYTASSDQTRELFIGILGHDLRAPLASMKIAGAMLKRPEFDCKKVPELGVRVERSAGLMTSLVDDLLGYTRIKMGVEIPMSLELVDLSEACSSAVADVNALHPATTIRMQINGSLMGSFDIVRIIQLLTNLLKNAAQYGTPGCEVLLRASGEPDYVKIQVNNQGAPIPPEAVDAVFQPLVRMCGDKPDATPRTSLGLGLYVARQSAIAHSGSLSVESTEVEGTTFTAILPRNSAPKKTI